MKQTKIILDLKKQISESISIHDEVVCDLCDNLIKEATIVNDTESIAFAYIWKADHYFYVKPDRNSMITYLSEAKAYIDEKKANDMLEKYYNLCHLYYETIADYKSSLSYCLKALHIAQLTHDDLRISANLGNIGDLYLKHECYHEALDYLNRSFMQLDHEDAKNFRIMRLILASLFDCLIYLGKFNEAKQTIDYLTTIKLEEKDLKIYVDRCKMIYYSFLKDCSKTNAYAERLLADGAFEFVNNDFAFDFISNLFHSMMRVKNSKKALCALEMLDQLIKDNFEKRLKVASYKIEYYKEYDVDKLKEGFKAYFHDYNNASHFLEQLKAEGLKGKLLLHETTLRQSKMREKIKTMENEANLDDLTQVYNRRFFNQKQNEILNDTRNKSIGFIILDVDYFKEYNDKYGHILGDKILKDVAYILKRNALENMEVCRYGGDEFICIVWNCSLKELKSYIEVIQKGLFDMNIEHNGSLCSDQITLSIGYGIHKLPMHTHLYSFIEEVDKALYKAKESGRNCAIALSSGSEVNEHGE